MLNFFDDEQSGGEASSVEEVSSRSKKISTFSLENSNHTESAEENSLSPHKVPKTNAHGKSVSSDRHRVVRERPTDAGGNPSRRESSENTSSSRGRRERSSSHSNRLGSRSEHVDADGDKARPTVRHSMDVIQIAIDRRTSKKDEASTVRPAAPRMVRARSVSRIDQLPPRATRHSEDDDETSSLGSLRSSRSCSAVRSTSRAARVRSGPKIEDLPHRATKHSDEEDEISSPFTSSRSPPNGSTVRSTTSRMARARSAPKMEDLPRRATRDGDDLGVASVRSRSCHPPTAGSRRRSEPAGGSSLSKSSHGHRSDPLTGSIHGARRGGVVAPSPRRARNRDDALGGSRHAGLRARASTTTVAVDRLQNLTMLLGDGQKQAEDEDLGEMLTSSEMTPKQLRKILEARKNPREKTCTYSPCESLFSGIEHTSTHGKDKDEVAILSPPQASQRGTGPTAGVPKFPSIHGSPHPKSLGTTDGEPKITPRKQYCVGRKELKQHAQERQERRSSIRTSMLSALDKNDGECDL